MINILDNSKCSGCGACYSVCPKHCIEMKVDSEGFLYPQVDESSCIGCNKCDKICPIINQTLSNDKSSKGYVAYNNNEDLRLLSSSGGIFTLLAMDFIKNGGVVFGASFDEDFSVSHIGVDNEKDLSLLRGSKYTQSKIGKTFINAEKLLKRGKRVMFVGTPCQIEGFKSYLQKDYDNLLLVDFICHGVPSPKLLELYFLDKERRYKSKISKVSFRDKQTGWRNYSVVINFENSKKYSKPHEEDDYMRLFLSNICLRPSCYECAFKKENRLSDITLADLWGASSILSYKDDDKGLSFIITHSLKGEKAFNQIGNLCSIEKINLDTAINNNPSMIKSSYLPKNRDEFFKNLDKINFKKASKTYAPIKITLKDRLYKFFKKIGVLSLIKK